MSILIRLLFTRTIVILPAWAHKCRTGYFGVYATLCLENIGLSCSSKVCMKAVVPACVPQQQQKRNHHQIKHKLNKLSYLLTSFLVLIENRSHISDSHWQRHPFYCESKKQTSIWRWLCNSRQYNLLSTAIIIRPTIYEEKRKVNHTYTQINKKINTNKHS